MTDRKGDLRPGSMQRKRRSQSVKLIDRRLRWRWGALLAPLVLVAATTVTMPAAPVSASDPSPWPAGFPQLPLGPDDLAQQVTVEQLEPGVNVTTVVRGQPDPDAFWSVTVKIADDGSPDPDAPQTVIGTRENAQATADRLVAKGFSPRVERVDSPGYADLPAGTLGWRVRVGHFPDANAAKPQVNALKAAGYLTQVDYTGNDGSATTGPWRVQIVTVDQKLLGQVAATYGKAIAGRETTSAMSRADGALAAINAGFFVIPSASGFPGEPSGLGVYGGRFDSEASNGRAGLVLDGERTRIGRLTSASTVISEDGTTHVLNGVNRKPGIIHLCGEPGSQPTEAPEHAFECTNPNDMVLDTSDLGAKPATGAGLQATLDPQGHVTSLGPLGGPVPEQGSVLQATGSSVDWLKAHATPGTHLQFVHRVRDDAGQPVPLTPNTDIVAGGPLLVRQGQPFVDVRAEGDVYDADPSFLYGYAIQRNPRTMVGIDAEGRLLLVTVDGREPGYSAGLGFTEEAQLMHALGAVEALNLDGGGSTTMAIRGQVVNAPSDATGERPVGDAIEVLPARRGGGAQ